MRTIGLIHGMSSVATVDFYRRVNDSFNDELGGQERPEIVMASVNFAVIERCVRTQAWAEMTDYLLGKARAVAAAGADFLVIGSNTGHVAADAIQQAVDLPFVHIGDAIADAAAGRGATTLALVGSRPVMEGDFYRRRLLDRGLDVMIPDEPDRTFVHDIVFDELAHNIFTDATRTRFASVVQQLRADGADLVVLGCTEYGLLVSDDDLAGVPVVDTTVVHVQAVVRAALAAGVTA